MRRHEVYGYVSIILTQHSNAAVWLVNGCYTSIKPPSQHFGTIFFAEISKIRNITYNFQILMTELQL